MSAAGGTDEDRSTRRRPLATARERARGVWVATPLRTRLAATTAVLLGLGLLLAGVTSVTLLRGTLMDQIDAKLASEGRRLATASVDALSGFRDMDFPTDYYVLIRAGGREFPLGYPNTVSEYGTPTVPSLTAGEVADLAGAPYSAPSDMAGSRWRMVTYLFPEGDGSVTVALPQRDVDRTLKDTARLLVVSGLAIVVLGVLAGAWAVRRSLRPLREIETTAAAIAAGDLSQRVPTAPPSTEVGRLGDALNGMLAQIEQAFDARTASEARMRRFVADASHELRTPLATIRGYAELYRMGALTTDDEVTDTMRRVEGSATRMGSLVEDLLALARLDEGRRGELGPVDLTVLAADAVSDLRALDPQRPVRLEPLGGAMGPRVVVGDEPRLRQVLANLVGNAARHTPAGTPVEIAVGAGPDERTAVLEVRDHGPGIPDEHAGRVFERFYRVDPSRTRDSGGSGLGMAIVAAIVASHAGAVAVHPTPGGGATVRVELPVAGPPVTDPRPAGAPPAPDVATMAGPSSPS
ncbi:sensor histidine kinase [Cellulomonas phragmiteti]|uniref:histidine kinase n=1 Tax=Cellulomonas phragmiteti TaxID=478780 RepID=A0ABQ4DHL6_9CELL|nr:HAMP domain-containing sensor histidine kinase [Cellulomonas phragmiteti]GIG38819.1 two-component sensor histidine kinase [Cellulomonas phragmiteti]